MKWKVFFLAAVTVLLAACGETYQATDTGTVTVSRSANRAFVAQYPNGTNVVWSYYDPNVIILDDWELAGWTTPDVSDYVVRFNMDEEDYYAWYDSDGTWIGTAYVIRDHTRLPVSINNSIHALYPSYTMTKVNREFYADRSVYEVTLKNDTNKVVLLVDDYGNVLKTKVKVND